MNHIQLGHLGEEAAAQYLCKAGYRIVKKNFRSKAGEIDIIARQKQCLVFVEVKTRSSTSYGWPSEAVTYSKQQKIMNTALCYVSLEGLDDSELRFDVMEVFLTDEGMKCNHIINAFGR